MIYNVKEPCDLVLGDTEMRRQRHSRPKHRVIGTWEGPVVPNFEEIASRSR